MVKNYPHASFTQKYICKNKCAIKIQIRYWLAINEDHPLSVCLFINYLFTFSFLSLLVTFTYNSDF